MNLNAGLRAAFGGASSTLNYLDKTRRTDLLKKQVDIQNEDLLMRKEKHALQKGEDRREQQTKMFIDHQTTAVNSGVELGEFYEQNPHAVSQIAESAFTADNWKRYSGGAAFGGVKRGEDGHWRFMAQDEDGTRFPVERPDGTEFTMGTSTLVNSVSAMAASKGVANAYNYLKQLPAGSPEYGKVEQMIQSTVAQINQNFGPIAAAEQLAQGGDPISFEEEFSPRTKTPVYDSDVKEYVNLMRESGDLSDRERMRKRPTSPSEFAVFSMPSEEAEKEELFKAKKTNLEQKLLDKGVDREFIEREILEPEKRIFGDPVDPKEARLKNLEKLNKLKRDIGQYTKAGNSKMADLLQGRLEEAQSDRDNWNRLFGIDSTPKAPLTTAGLVRDPSQGLPEEPTGEQVAQQAQANAKTVENPNKKVVLESLDRMLTTINNKQNVSAKQARTAAAMYANYMALQGVNPNQAVLSNLLAGDDARGSMANEAAIRVEQIKAQAKNGETAQKQLAENISQFDDRLEEFSEGQFTKRDGQEFSPDYRGINNPEGYRAFFREYTTRNLGTLASRLKLPTVRAKDGSLALDYAAMSDRAFYKLNNAIDYAAKQHGDVDNPWFGPEIVTDGMNVVDPSLGVYESVAEQFDMASNEQKQTLIDRYGSREAALQALQETMPR